MSLLSVRDLRVTYAGRGAFAKPNEVLRGISLEVNPGETLGVVGESGSGKTTVGRSILGLVRPASGQIVFDGDDITRASVRKRRALASKMQVVFQDPYTSLNPSLNIGDTLAEPLIAQGVSGREARDRVRTVLDQVGLPADSSQRKPREFSGGQRQRIAIARALVTEPRLIVCDEPVSALDLSTQAHVLDLLIEVQQRTGVAYLFVTHDLAVVRHISHRVCVMRRGEIVESGPAVEVTSTPEHPYTQQMLFAAPLPDPQAQAQRRAERHRLQETLRQQDEQAGAIA